MRPFGLPVKRLVLTPDEWREADRRDARPAPAADAVSGTTVDDDWWAPRIEATATREGQV